MRTLTCLVLLTLVPTAVLAQHDTGRPDARRRPAGPAVAILYSEPDFQGDAYEIYPGDEIGDLREVRFPGGGKINDRVSSIRVLGGMKLDVYTDPRFRGGRLSVDADVPDLRRLLRPGPGPGSWDDAITAVRADPPARERPRPEPERPHRPHGSRGPACVILYADPDFQGDALELDPGAEIQDLRDIRFPDGSKINDRVSSIRILGGVHLTVYADPDCRGDQVLLTEDVRDLRQLKRGSGARLSWDETISALRVGLGRRGRP